MSDASERRFAPDGRPQGWFSEEECAAYAEAVGMTPGGKVLEVGTWLGRSLSAIMPTAIKHNTDVTVVDTWQGSIGAQTKKAIDAGLKPFSAFKANMEFLGFWGKFSYHTMPSVAAAKHYTDGFFDLVFIDANHDYEAVKADILAWMPKVKPGGLLLGHDYYTTTANPHPGVRQAVKELCLPDRVDDSLWWKEIPKA